MSEVEQITEDDRLARFEGDLAKLGVGRPAPGRDRALMLAGGLLIVIGLVVAFVGLNLTRSAATELEQGDGLAQVQLGVGVVVVGCVLWLRFSLGRYLRYWMLRAIHERRS